ncbi:hypothetical protein C8R45DRAFT_1206959 [Mycena sanguinolenta]|nr:hypothetical protein C8R45DRAFT_1206959 [Mycena sanguinolenta]
MAVDIPSIFGGVVYRIDPRSDDYDLLRFLLEHNGGKESKDPYCQATRIIVDPQHFALLEQVGCKTHNPTVVSPEWVYSSVKFGAKRQAQYYSADPALFFSSAVVSVSGSLRDAVAKYGGKWLSTPTGDVTHLIVDPIMIEPGDDPLGPILVHANWAIHSVVNKIPLPSAPYEINSKPGSKSRSAARRFCEAQFHLHHEEETPTLPGGPLPLLPFEILGNIFVEFRNDALRNSSSVAHNTGELWTHLRLKFHCEKHYGRLRNLVEQWLARTYPRALSFRISSCYPGTENPIIGVLLAHASRFRDLSLQLPVAQFIPFLQAPAGSFPSLEQLTISILSVWDSTYDPESGLSRYEYFEEYDRTGCDDGILDEEALWGTMTAPMTSLQDAPRLRRMEIDCSYF